jgi:hypothetical protein
MRERERNLGLEADDAAATWLAGNEPKEEQPPSRSAFKSKALHRWRQGRLSRP